MSLVKIQEILRSRPVYKKIAIWTLVFLFVVALTGFFVMPPILKSVLTKKLSERLHREVSIKDIDVNPFMLSLKVEGFLVKERNSTDKFLSFDELYVNLQSISIFKGGPVIREVRIQNPYINVKRDQDQSYNFSDLLEKKETPKPEQPNAKPFRFSVNNIQIINGGADFMDSPKNTSHTVRNLKVMIPFVSNLPYYVDTYVQPAFDAEINKHTVSFKGSSKPFNDSLETSLDINIKDFNIPYYLAYVPFKMDYKVLSGYFDAETKVKYIQYKNKVPSINFSGDIFFKTIKVDDLKGAPLINFPLIQISFAQSDVMARQFHLSKIFVDTPEINAVIDKKHKINLMAMVPETNKAEKTGSNKETKKETKETAVPLALDIDEIKVKDAKLAFTDLSRPKNFRTILSPVQININNFSNSPQKKGTAELSALTEAAESINVKSGFSVEPLAADGNVEIKQIVLKKYAPYYDEKALFNIEDGKFDFATNYVFSGTASNPEVRFSEMGAAVSNLRMKKKNEKEVFLKVPLFQMKGATLDYPEGKLEIGELSTSKGMVLARRQKDGTMNLTSLMAPSAGQQETQVEAKTGKPGKPAKPEKPWIITLKKIALEQYTLKAEDLVPSEPVVFSAEQVRFRGENISTAKKSRGRVQLSFKTGKGGSVLVSGPIGVEPAFAKMKVNVKDFEITPFEPYFAEKLKIILTDGKASASGDLSLTYSKETGPKASYKGEASLTDIATVDKLNAEDFLKWNSLYFSNMDVGYNPLYVNIKEVALSDFYSRIVINSDGSINVQDIMEKGSAPAKEQTAEVPAREQAPEASAEKQDVVAEAKKEAATKLIKIETVTFQGGTINFSDRHIKPNYTANMLDIGGKVSGLSSEENTLADVDLKGKIDDYAPLEIKGKINPLKEDLYVDLKIDFKNMELSPVTPYSGRFAGYTIQKGKLSLHLEYLIVNKKLDSKNRFFIDQFTFGEKVDSPDATKLPVRLAIALLKNRKGEIDLDIPVSGQTDDPKFSVGKIILKVLLNLLAKAATSPFALLGAVFGGGEELSYVDFDYGSPDMDAEKEKKLDILVKALYDRPALKLEIEGHVDTEKDREGLRQNIFNKKMKAQKLKDIIKRGETAVPVDEVKIEQSEYQKYLKLAYKEEKFPKPRNIVGMAKDIPGPEMEKLMQTHIEVKDSDLRQLASQRASTIKDYILKSGKVEPERVFLIEPKTLQPEKKEKLKDSRVDFKLK